MKCLPIKFVTSITPLAGSTPPPQESDIAHLGNQFS